MSSEEENFDMEKSMKQTRARRPLAQLDISDGNMETGIGKNPGTTGSKASGKKAEATRKAESHPSKRKTKKDNKVGSVDKAQTAQPGSSKRKAEEEDSDFDEPPPRRQNTKGVDGKKDEPRSSKRQIENDEPELTPAESKAKVEGGDNKENNLKAKPGLSKRKTEKLHPSKQNTKGVDASTAKPDSSEGKLEGKQSAKLCSSGLRERDQSDDIQDGPPLDKDSLTQREEAVRVREVKVAIREKELDEREKAFRQAQAEPNKNGTPVPGSSRGKGDVKAKPVKPPGDLDVYFTQTPREDGKRTKYICKICKKGPFASNEAKYHLDSHRGTRDLCSATFSTRRGLDGHVKRREKGKCPRTLDIVLPIKQFEAYAKMEAEANESQLTTSSALASGGPNEFLISKFNEFLQNIKALADESRIIYSGVLKKRINLIEFYLKNILQGDLTYMNSFDLLDNNTLKCKICSKRLLVRDHINQVMRMHFNSCTNFKKDYPCDKCCYTTTTQILLDRHKERGHVEIAQQEKNFSFDGQNQVRFGIIAELNLKGRQFRPHQLYGLVMTKKGEEDIEFTNNPCIAEAITRLEESNTFKGPEVEGEVSKGCSFQYYLMRGWKMSKAKSFILNIKCYDQVTARTVKYLCRRLTGSTCVLKTTKSIFRTVFCRNEIISKLTEVEEDFPKDYLDFFKVEKLKKLSIPRVMKKLRDEIKKRKVVKAELLISQTE